MALSTKVAGWASGVNWYLLAAKAAVVLAVMGFCYMEGAHRCELKNEQQKTAQAKQETQTVIKEVQVRVPVVQTVEKKSIEYRDRVAQTGAKLDEANKASNAGTCNLSAEQLQYLKQLAEATK